MKHLVIIGAGGFGRETLDVVEAINASQETPLWEVLGVVDDSPSARALSHLADRNVQWLGTVDEWLARESPAAHVVAVGNPLVRKAIVRRIESALGSLATLVHPKAVIGSLASVGQGSIICGGAQISTNVRVGEHVHINPNATVGHDAQLREGVSLNPGAIVSGEVAIGPHTLIGAGAVILQGLSVGSECVVGASACVVRDVPDCATVKGVPAR